MNAIYGNVSKELANQQIEGKETKGAEGKEITDPGILTEERLRAVDGPSMADESQFHLNDVKEPKEEAVTV